jgi:transposase-like protein
MTKKERRHLSPDEKLKIIEEARAPGATVAEVLRRHQVDAPSFYKWERDAKAGAREALNGKKRSKVDRRDEEIEKLKAELTRKRELIAEIAEENLTLKKGL